ncbi:Protein of unknown function (DUF2034) domain containing protein [Rhypophila decipiens]
MLIRSSYRMFRIALRPLGNTKTSQSLLFHNPSRAAAVRHLSAEQFPTDDPEESSITTGAGSAAALDKIPSLQPTPTRTIPNLEYPVSKSAFHNDLQSFLQYVERVGLAKSSTVFVGTHFEYTVAATLALYGFFLRRIGGVSDAGVDLLGTWSIPLSSPLTEQPQQEQETQPERRPPLRVIIQCKVTPNPRPGLIRELEGAFIGAPAGWRMTSPSSGDGVLGILVLDKPTTKGIREAMGRSRWPMGFVYCSKEGVVEQFLWNERAVAQGLEGLGAVKRYAPQGQQVALTFKGRILRCVLPTGMEGSE